MNNCNFAIDDHILSSCFTLGQWTLSTVLLKNNANYPWLILVPRVAQAKEIDQLPQETRYLLMDEISKLAFLVRTYFKPDKLNVGTLGNIVSQLHIHVVGRFIDDELWPHGVWQKELQTTNYSKSALSKLMTDLGSQVASLRDVP